MRSFIDQHRERFRVEPICTLLRVAPSAYWRHVARQRDPSLLSARARRDAFLVPHIQRVWQANFQVYGADKVWRQLQREGIQVARRTVERLMRRLGLRGVRRDKVVRTTFADTAAPCPLDRVNRQFKADRPNQLWVSDFTNVSTWTGFVYVAFVIDVFARRIVGWRVSRSVTVRPPPSFRADRNDDRRSPGSRTAPAHELRCRGANDPAAVCGPVCRGVF